MTFNKKLLVLAIAHFAFAQLVFSSERDEKEGSKTAVAAAKYVESGLVSLNSYVDLDKAVDKGSAACQGCRQAN